jgi:hypothetical protein
MARRDADRHAARPAASRKARARTVGAAVVLGCWADLDLLPYPNIAAREDARLRCERRTQGWPEEASNFGNCNGVIHITLATYRHLPDGKGGIATKQASIRGNIQAMTVLRNAIDGALLLATPAAGGAEAN